MIYIIIKTGFLGFGRKSLVSAESATKLHLAYVSEPRQVCPVPNQFIPWMACKVPSFSKVTAWLQRSYPWVWLLTETGFQVFVCVKRSVFVFHSWWSSWGQTTWWQSWEELWPTIMRCGSATEQWVTKLWLGCKLSLKAILFLSPCENTCW